MYWRGGGLRSPGFVEVVYYVPISELQINITINITIAISH